MVKQNMTPIQKAIYASGGTQTELARRVGCSPQNITNIKKRDGRIPHMNREKRDRWVAATGLSEKELFPERFS